MEDGGWTGAGTGEDPVAAGLRLVAEGLELVLGARGWTLTDDQVLDAIRETGRLRHVADAAHLHLVRLAETKDSARSAGAPSTAAWMRAELHLSPGRARADVEAAALTDPDTGPLAAMGAAHRQGRVSTEHVDVARRVLERIPRHLREAAGADEGGGRVVLDERVEHFLLDQSLRHTPGEVSRLGKHLLAVLDPDGTDRHDPDPSDRRHCRVAVDDTGMVRGTFALPGPDGAPVKVMLDFLATPDPAGPDAVAVTGGERRTPGQRYADALAEMARLAMARAGDEGRTKAGEGPTVLVHVTPEQLADALPGAGSEPAPDVPPGGATGSSGKAAPGLATCEATGPVPAWALRRLACDSRWQAVLLDERGAPLRLGRAARFATPAQRRALAARDRGCAFPGCGRPSSWCDVHHDPSWTRGGATDVDRMVLLCGFHHGLCDREEWTITWRDGLPWFVPPPWVDPSREPLRNTWAEDVDRAHRMGQRLRSHLARRRPTGTGPP